MTTWSTIRSQIRAEIEEPTAAVWSDDSLLSWYNAAAKDYSRRARPMQDEQYATLTVGQDGYDLPSDTLTVDSAWINQVSLERNDYSEFVRLTATGLPTNYAVYNDAIYFYPTPNSATVCTIIRYCEPTALTAASDTTPFGGEEDEYLKAYVKARAYEQTMDYDSANFFRGVYEQAVRERDWMRLRLNSSGDPDTPRTEW